MKRPLVTITLLFAGGLVLGTRFSGSLWLLLALAFVVLAAALLWPRGRPWLLLPLAILAGWANLVSRTAILSPHDLRLLEDQTPALVTLQGTLDATPAHHPPRQDPAERGRTLAPLNVSRINREGYRWEPAFGRVMVVMPGLLPPEFFAGQTVEVSGVLAPPPAPDAEGLFDYRSYLRHQGIYFQLRADSTNDWRLLSATRPPPVAQRFAAWAQDVLSLGLPERDVPLELLWAMTLGWKTALTPEVSTTFIRSGTMHIFAISGLHIAMIAAILLALLRVLRVPRFYCGILVIPTLWFYTLATGWQPSAIRSTIMMTVVIAGWGLARPSDLLNSLAGAALIILVWDPQQLFGASFQLSFFVVLSIALLVPVLEQLRDRVLHLDPWLPEQLASPWQRVGLRTARWLWTFSAASTAAWLGSLPLIAFYFYLVSPVALAANLLIVPASGAALAASLGSLFCGAWLPGLAEVLNFSAWGWMRLMLWVSDVAVALPGGWFHLARPTLPQFVLYYGLLIGCASGWLLAPGRRRWLLPGAAVLLAASAIPGFNHRQEVHLTVLAQNGAVSVYCTPAAGAGPILIDSGDSNVVQYVVEPHLRARGVNGLSDLVLTHGDLRHVGGAEWIIRQFKARRVIAGVPRFRSPTYRRLMQTLGGDNGILRLVNRGETFGGWTVLHPDGADRFSRADDAALVVRGEFHGRRILLLSDLGRAGQETLLERYGPKLRADVVVTGLPGSGEPLCDGLLEAIQPSVIVVADCEYPASERAKAALLERLGRGEARILSTRAQGAITIRISKRGELQASGFRSPLTDVPAAPDIEILTP
jgi:ComEC/Rec2-related protein